MRIGGSVRQMRWRPWYTPTITQIRVRANGRSSRTDLSSAANAHTLYLEELAQLLHHRLQQRLRQYGVVRGVQRQQGAAVGGAGGGQRQGLRGGGAAGHGQVAGQRLGVLGRAGRRRAKEAGGV